MSASLPVGSVTIWCGSNDAVPAGWLYCNGRVLEQASYPALFGAIGHSFGNPKQSSNYDQNSQFFLPDFRGCFLRGVDDGANRDPDVAERTDMQSGSQVGGVVGSMQSDEFRSHTHGYQESTYQNDGQWSGGDWYNSTEQTGAAGGNETRPINAYVYYIIKFE